MRKFRVLLKPLLFLPFLIITGCGGPPAGPAGLAPKQLVVPVPQLPQNTVETQEDKVSAILQSVTGEIFDAGEDQSSQETVILAKINSEEINLEMFQEELDNIPSDQRQKVSSMEFLNRMVDMYLIMNEIREERFYDDPAYKQLLGRVSRELISSEFGNQRYNSIFDKLEIESSEIEKYYIEHQDTFKISKQIHARQILISTDNGRSKEEALEKTGSILQELKALDFAEAARKYSEDDATRSNGGDLGFFTPDALIKPLNDFVEKAKPGDVSEPVETPGGYYLLKVEEIRENILRPLENVREEIRDTLKRKEATQRYELWKEQTLADYKSDIREDLLNKQNLPPETVIATVETDEITFHDLLEQIKKMPAMVHKAYERTDERVRLLHKMIDDQKLYLLAEKSKLPSDPECQGKLASMEKNLLINSYIDKKIAENVTNNEKFKQKFFADFVKQVRVSHIFLKADKNSTDEVTSAEVRSKQTLKELRNGGDFVKLATTWNGDSSRMRGGDLGYFSKGMLGEPLESAVFSLGTGEISEIVHSSFGFHILMVTDIREDQARKDQLAEGESSYRSAMVQEFYLNWLRQLRERSRIEVYPERLPKN
ncbi:MAG: peptidylprolyl isomerase [Candidatus Wallbacteria bacterium]|nr:peptidylprolyl isomerase [Candidatus Wallbacteria bacterium]